MNEVTRVVERSPQLLRHKGLPFRRVATPSVQAQASLQVAGRLWVRQP